MKPPLHGLRGQDTRSMLGVGERLRDLSVPEGPVLLAQAIASLGGRETEPGIVAGSRASCVDGTEAPRRPAKAPVFLDPEQITMPGIHCRVQQRQDVVSWREMEN